MTEKNAFYTQVRKTSFNYKPNCTVHSPWREYSRSAGQEIPCSLWNSKVYYNLHKSPEMDPILSQLNSVDVLTFYIIKSTF
jgi:hypothetical protein